MKIWIIFCLFVQNAFAMLGAADIKLKNANEIYYSLAAITGISEFHPETIKVFKETKERLPRFGGVNEMSSPMILAVTELSGMFCALTVELESKMLPAERTLFSQIDFERGIEQLNETQLKKVLDPMAEVYWNREMMPLEREHLRQLIFTLAHDDFQSVARLSAALKYVCSTMGTSVSFLMK